MNGATDGPRFLPSPSTGLWSDGACGGESDPELQHIHAPGLAAWREPVHWCGIKRPGDPFQRVHARCGRDTSLPIRRDDQIGLEAANGAGTPISGATGAVLAVFNDFADGSPSGPPGSILVGTELLFNADVEPTNTFSISPVQPNKKAGTATLIATVPNPGTLQLQGSTVMPQARSLQSGQQYLTLAPTRSTRKRLKKKGKASGQADVIYTPNFGTPSTQTVPFVLKLKRKKKR